MSPIPASLRFPLGLAALLLVVFLVYAPGLSGDFVFDDFANIVANKKVHAEKVDLQSLSTAAGAYQGPIGRPLATMGFAVDHALGGRDPLAFKLHSLIVHLVNTLLVLLLCRRLMAIDGASTTPAWVPWAIAALWSIHPLQVSTVLYVVQRMEMLAVMFLLMGLLAYLHGRMLQIQGSRGWPWLVASGALAATGLLAKESAVLFPLFTLALEATVLRFRAAGGRTTKVLKAGYAAVVVIGIIGYFALFVPRFGAPAAFDNRDFTLQERMLTQLRVLPMYLKQVLLPLPGSMTFYYDDFPKSSGWLSPPTTLFGGVLLAGLLALAWALRRAIPLVALGLFWFFVPHLLTSGAVNLELAFEHRNYLAILGVLIATTAGLRKLRWRPSPEAALAATVAVVGMLAALSGIRAATWGDPLVLAMDMVARSPTSARASSDLGSIYARYAMAHPGSPYLDFALNEFQRGAKLPGASPLPEQGLILLSIAGGRPVQDSWWEQLYAKLRSNPIGPQEVMAVTGLLSERLKGTPVDDIALAEAYGILMERGGASAEAYLGFANHAENYLRDDALAERLYVAAMASDSMSPEYAQRVLFALATEGKQRFLDSAAREAVRRGLVDED